MSVLRSLFEWLWAAWYVSRERKLGWHPLLLSLVVALAFIPAFLALSLALDWLTR